MRFLFDESADFRLAAFLRDQFIVVTERGVRIRSTP